MKKRVLLIDESLTVQKVVALTLDKSRYSVAYAKSRAEAMQYVAESPPNLIMVSDQVTDVSVASFPKEVEAWLGRHHKAPPCLLITGQDIREMRHYAAVLKKPFSPQALQSLVTEHTQGADAAPPPQAAPQSVSSARDLGEEQKLQARFHETFNDEAKLVRETFQQEIEEEERTLLTIPAPHVNEPPPREAKPTRQASFAPPPPPAAPSDDLWSPTPVAPPPRPAAPAAPPAPEILRGTDSMAYKAALESQVESALERENLTEIVRQVLDRLLPPIVERLVQERLDRLLKEQEDYVELKP